MNVRTPFLGLAFFAVAIAATVVGCSAPGSMHSALPPSGALLASGDAARDQEAALAQRVAQAHQTANGAVAYGEIQGEWVAPDPAPGRPGYYLVDGEVVPGPPDDRPLEDLAPQSGIPEVPAPTATMNCKTFSGAVPPPCTLTGPFRRVYSDPGYSFALAHLSLPASKITTMPDDPDTQNGDIGYVYMEGWASGNPDLGNSEFGFQYSPVHNYYSPYIRTDNPKAFFLFKLGTAFVHYLPSAPITFAFAGYTIGPQNYMHVAVIGTADVFCTPAGQKTQTHTCLGHGHEPDNDWSPKACCIMARMTTIGQTNPNDAFYDGAKFGPITWSGVELAPTPPPPAPGSTILPLTGKQPPWKTADTQNWPPLQDKVVVEEGSGETGETDTIDLAKLAPFSFSVSPSSEQSVRPATTIKYNAVLKGGTGGLTYEYGWRLINPLAVTGDTLAVPGATPYPKGSGGIGPGTAATLNIGSEQGPYALYVNTYLYFVDAADNLKALSQTSDFVHVGIKK